MRVKICGITKLEQGQAIADMGATALGFICFLKSPRYVTPENIKNIVEKLPINIDKIGVFVNLEIIFLYVVFILKYFKIFHSSSNIRIETRKNIL